MYIIVCIYIQQTHRLDVLRWVGAFVGSISKQWNGDLFFFFFIGRKYYNYTQHSVHD